MHHWHPYVSVNGSTLGFLLLTGLSAAEAAVGLGLPIPELTLDEKEFFLKVSYNIRCLAFTIIARAQKRPANRRCTGF